MTPRPPAPLANQEEYEQAQANIKLLLGVIGKGEEQREDVSVLRLQLQIEEERVKAYELAHQLNQPN